MLYIKKKHVELWDAQKRLKLLVLLWFDNKIVETGLVSTSYEQTMLSSLLAWLCIVFFDNAQWPVLYSLTFIFYEFILNNLEAWAIKS